MKLTLDIQSMQTEYFTDVALIGISSSVPDYRFCWLLNRCFNLKLARDMDSDIEVQTKGDTLVFPIYRYEIPLNGNRYLLYKLKSEKESLLPEIRQLDYLWMIQHGDAETEASGLIRHLRNFAEVQLAQRIAVDKIRHLSNLII